MADIPDNAFPRALFGLPIIFHFKDRNDPQDTELSCHRGRERKNRMASPLIIKPLALAEDRAVSMVMVLDAPEPENLGLFSQGNDLLAGARNILIQDPALERYRNSPMRRYSPEGNALEAFVTFANAQGVARRIDLA
jgi:CRISPR-associated protein Cmr1